MTFVKNAVDGVRRQVKVWVNTKYNGRSHVKQLGASMTQSGMEAGEVVQTVLLSDIFKEALRQSQPNNVIMKVDIETFECRAFLGSPQGKNCCENIVGLKRTVICFCSFGALLCQRGCLRVARGFRKLFKRGL